MRVAVVGFGSIGQRHALNAFAMGHEVFVHDLHWTSERMIGAVAYEAVDRLSKVAGCDAVMICTPAATHASVASELLAAGYKGPLFVEKPLATSLNDCEVFQTWPHPTTMVGYNWRHHTAVRTWLNNPWHWLYFRCESDISSWPGANYADPLLEFSHEIDLAMMLGARFGIAGSWFGGDGAWLQFQTPSILIDVRWNGAAKAARLVSGHSIRDGLTHALDLQGCDDCQREIDQSYVDELKQFFDCAQRGVATMTPFVDGIRVLDIIRQAKAMTGAHERL